MVIRAPKPTLLDAEGRPLLTAPADKREWPYLVIFREGGDNRKPLYFCTHISNLSKFDNPQKRSEGFRIIGPVGRKGALSPAEAAGKFCREQNAKIK